MSSKPRKIFKLISIFLCLSLFLQQSGFAQVAGELNIAGHIASLRNSLTQDKFRPLHLRFLSYNPQENNFRLLLDKGNFKNPNNSEIEDASKIILKYFFIGISLPNDSFWVNLRPDSPDNIIDEDLAKTDIGKVFLESDLQLKKDTAKATSPETPEGREYWNKLYQKAGELFGASNITIPTLTRPWIVPGEIIIRETGDSAYIYKATLKVMLEQDYLKNDAVYNFKDEKLKQLNEYASQLVRELIIPKLTKEINTSKRYASLRQVYYSLIMAHWFKSRFSGKSGLYASLIDRRNLNGLNSLIPCSKENYFKEYQKSFKEGEYNIQESIQTPFGQTIRSYFSGGIEVGGVGVSKAIVNGARVTSTREAPAKTFNVREVFGRSTSAAPYSIEAKAGPENVSAPEASAVLSKSGGVGKVTIRADEREEARFATLNEAFVHVRERIKETDRPVILLFSGKSNTGKSTLLSAILRPEERQRTKELYEYDVGILGLKPQDVLGIRDRDFWAYFERTKRGEETPSEIYEALYPYLQALIGDKDLLKGMTEGKYLSYFVNEHLPQLLQSQNKSVVIWDEAFAEGRFALARRYIPQTKTPFTVISLTIEEGQGGVGRSARVSSWEWGRQEAALVSAPAASSAMGIIPVGESEQKVTQGNDYGTEFDTLMKEELEKEIKSQKGFSPFQVQRAEEIDIRNVYIVDYAPAGGRVYRAESSGSDNFLIFADKNENVIAVAVDSGGENSFGISRIGGRDMQTGYTMLEEESRAVIAKKFVEYKTVEARIKDRSEEFGSMVREPKIAKMFLPLINPYFSIEDLRNYFIENSVIRNLVRHLGAEAILTFQRDILFEYKLKRASGISSSGHTAYSLQYYRMRDKDSLPHIESVAHEFTHEIFRRLDKLDTSARIDLAKYFFDNRKSLEAVIRSSPLYKDRIRDAILTEMLAYIVGNLARGNLMVTVGSGIDEIQKSDVAILLKHKLLPAEFEGLFSDGIAGIKPGERIYTEDLARVSPQAREILQRTRPTGNASGRETVPPAVQSDLGAQVANARNLQVLMRYLGRYVVETGQLGPARLSARFSSEAEFMNGVIAQLDNLVSEQEDAFGNKIVIINESQVRKGDFAYEMIQTIRSRLIRPQEGVKAVNFFASDGKWTVLMFSQEARDPANLRHEQREIALRKLGLSWRSAHELVEAGRDSFVEGNLNSQEKQEITDKLGQLKAILQDSSIPQAKRDLLFRVITDDAALLTILGLKPVTVQINGSGFASTNAADLNEILQKVNSLLTIRRLEIDGKNVGLLFVDCLKAGMILGDNNSGSVVAHVEDLVIGGRSTDLLTLDRSSEIKGFLHGIPATEAREDLQRGGRTLITVFSPLSGRQAFGWSALDPQSQDNNRAFGRYQEAYIIAGRVLGNALLEEYRRSWREDVGAQEEPGAFTDVPDGIYLAETLTTTSRSPDDISREITAVMNESFNLGFSDAEVDQQKVAYSNLTKSNFGGSRTILAAVRGGRMVGALNAFERSGGKSWHIASLGVKPGDQRGSVGTGLADQFIKGLIISTEAREFDIEVSPAAIDFWERYFVKRGIDSSERRSDWWLEAKPPYTDARGHKFFTVTINTKIAATQSEPLESAIADMVKSKKGEVVVTADNGERFVFRYSHAGSNEEIGWRESRYKVEVFSEGRTNPVGFVHFSVHEPTERLLERDSWRKTFALVSLSFKGEGDNNAIFVENNYRESGIGTSLMGFAMRLAIQMGAEKFEAQPVINDGFFKSLGFNYLGKDLHEDNAYDFRFNKGKELPQIAIHFQKANSDAKGRTGGIDFRALPITIQPPILPQGLPPSGLSSGLSKGAVPGFALKQLLVLLESDKPAVELKLALSGIEVTSKEPLLVTP
ncbi:MAG: hypothetical protein NTZ92_01320 [Candidatus Omnitrophica bacterium]|nr:hypothetical protein [Candidatus Omnitrophota bacterium]